MEYTSLQECAKVANEVQNACNLSGVAITFVNVLTYLWKYAHENSKGTDWVNTHPIVIVFLDKMSSLAGIQELGNSKVFRAFDEVDKLEKGE